MRPVAVAVIRAGLVPEEVLAEFKRWKLPISVVVEEPKDVLQDPKQIVNVIRDALESAEQVHVRDTDLDILQRFLDPQYQRMGKLIIKDGDEKATAKVNFCLTPLGEYTIPWRSDSIFDLMTNGETHLRYSDPDGTSHSVHFSDVREVFIGDRKAFMVCTPEADK